MNLDIINTDIAQDYQQFIAKAHIREAMAIEKFLNPIEEEEILREIESIEMENFIVQSAKTVDVDEAQEAAEAEVTGLYSDLCKEEQLTALAMAVAVYENWVSP